MTLPQTLASIHVAEHIRRLRRLRAYPPDLAPDETCGDCGGLVIVKADGTRRHYLGRCDA